MAGSTCPIEVMKQVISEMHASEITIAYGQTESSPVITQTRTDDPIELRVATVGRALPDVEVKIVDIETGATLPPGKQGELCTRGYLVMKGYYKMPEETAKAIDADGWLHTGDLAVMDENGYCKITGRIKNMIIRGGENIYPARDRGVPLHPPEDLRCPGLRRARPEVRRAGHGGHHPEKGGGDDRGRGAGSSARGKIANYKIPQYVKFVDSLSHDRLAARSRSSRLREMAIKELQLEDAGETA